ncbi:RnfABCDGE type electron transport complex subunit D [Marinitoga aeolica]|uniref:RnfABCDGE type electron transport complex subunit D n=1 Tax=Marinitoga aeolica TaxID=2809031 RepID=A0ABY8PN01_9BACT|nr:RnfABCDGE type electron transport complex subunit D [Marinitoga aeolica]WGS64024.1 RnfABCDGE type electron transport complex subunit D [Marinitoga aeolica]
MKKSFFLKQPMMRRVLYALTPIYLFALYFYGVRLLLLSVVVFGGGIITEYIMEKRVKKNVSEAVLVTSMLFVLSLPPLTPWWIALIGIIFGVLFGKEVFGGFGRNPFNPAIVGRLFIYITFPNIMTYGWMEPGNFGINAITTATPLKIMRSGEASFNLLKMFFGFRAGSMGESFIFLIIIAAIYLIYTKTASWKIILSTFLSATTMIYIFYFAGFINYPLQFLMSGSLLFVTVFMATDPISGPKNQKAHWYYGILIGVITILIRTFSLFPEGTSFAVLLGNTFAPLMDELLKKKVKK